jgi:hypothetical protein
MQLNPHSNRFRLSYSAVFEAAYYAIQAKHPFLLEAMDYVHWLLERTPYSEGEPCYAFEDRDIRVLLTPKTPRYPSLRVLFEIVDPRVHCYHISER